MLPTFVMAAALAVGAYEPVADVPLHKVPGPAFAIPCKLDGIEAVARVQLWVSADRGKTWELHEEITPDKTAFTFLAKKAGEYWFAPRVQKKDGTLLPADTGALVATQRVAVATGAGAPEPAVKPTPPTAAAIADELEEELTRVELDLIRKEIKRLSEAKELNEGAEDKLDRLRVRLRDVRERLRSDRDRTGPTLLLPAPNAPPDASIPPSAVPTEPLVIPQPARPVAPMPRAPGRPS